MEIGAILFILGLLALVAAYVARPLLKQRGMVVTEEDVEFSSLLAQRDRVLDALAELDMDRAMNKIDAHDYQRRRAELVKEGAELLRRIDELGAGHQAPSEGSAEDLESAIEAEVLKLRQRSSPDQSTKYCPACGAEALTEDKFCTQCGEPLAEASLP
ncbi:MAG: zinc ribbon domain-containing protein [Anaerolineales bacterium]